ncbi:chromosome segregation protein SMC [Microbacterium imperiale]|uniref:Chromosome partition protein Smc n=1 Tax=Microbacterium imperiale TaxID=33884 RepID=A0A9W6HED4_9MICO|nr:chromosome segregation protein SMC [Microbacterium imperiale]MBP2419598.1 chromosome segregation protein [Microbacterium imperiale]MDS0198535.1 chromosome segregation protein SMC [Microbacterium imperiale]BFE39940.1 chromosome segregation protein SMC [Microbacterium imperiale]GLJ79085.1 chromosome partition protein Smc [Microbacterium imperiale]
MHLKSVTLKGFKSFAQPTTFVLEPGVTCIVGPNGSGKSNVVDALAWVMGEQGAKTLRGGKMEDVIFAGTATRGPLGRAEVQLTIDNHDGVLPIEYSEVTISRTLFRNGASEYAINGETCRLLDVQELLSDSGLGREMHVIVGQGRLDTVLQASAEDRRGFIEEAAGILKHRRRKEKTVRKLEAMEANLTRLSDLAGELRRQLKPLGKQAEVAREAATIAAVVRDAKARLFADDLVSLRAQLADHARAEHERHAERVVLQDQLDGVKQRIDALEAEQRSEAVDRARATAFALEQVQERVRGLHTLTAQRRALLEDDGQLAVEVATVGQATIDEARQEVDEIAAGVGDAQDVAAAASRDVIRARAELDALDSDIAAQSALVSEHDMRLTKLRGRADAAASRLDALRAAVERQQRGLDAARSRRAEAEEALAAVQTDASPEASSAEHTAAYDRAQRDAADAEAQVSGIRERLHAAEREAESLTAQTAALGRALEIRNAAADLLHRGAGGVRSLVSDAVKVEPGYEAAVAAALGALAEGILVDDVAAAVAAADIARADDLGVVDIVLADASAGEPIAASSSGAVRAVDVTAAPPGVLGQLSAVLIVDDLAAATVLREQLDPADRDRAVIVTTQGELVSWRTLRAGSGAGRSRLELAAERDAAADRLSELTVVVDALRESLSDAQAAWNEARTRTRTTLETLRAHDAALAADAEKLNRATVRFEAAVAECDRLEAGLAPATAAVADAETAAREADDALAAATAAPRPILDASARDGLLDALERAREHEMRARLDVETLRERVRAGEARVAQLERQREREKAAAAEAARRAVIRRRQREVADAVASQLPPLMESIDRSVAQARVELGRAEQSRSEITAELSDLRQRDQAARARLAALTESVHGLEMQMHEKKLHVTSLLERVSSELGLEENILIAEYGPDQPIPGEDGDAAPFERGQQRRRLAEAERKLAQLGRVNPLALEEFSALEQRHAFLTEQLADLTQTRADLLTIIDELDERMQTIFLAAFEDTKIAFGEVFPILFPGGTGSISLTDPDHPLTTGIEVSVRPVGKKIERLSLLSGGERSLAAVALLTAIFKARPSPFYILDEVEAALDDANLGRLLGVFEQLRASSQLIVITHQKRTMEIADALYGVSMRQDGVSAVVGQRVRERAGAVG